MRDEGPTKEQMAEQEALSKFRKERARQDLAYVLADPKGRRFLWDLIGSTNPFTVGWEGNGSRMYYDKGARDMGLKMLNQIMAMFPEAYLQMQAEAITQAQLDVKKPVHAKGA